MRKVLIVVDMQNDFVDGSLGTPEAAAIVENVVRKIKAFEGTVFVTMDTHFENYLQTSEGRKLPVPHCVRGTNGWRLNAMVEDALAAVEHTVVEKITFGSIDLPKLLQKQAEDGALSIELIGLCTDICVVSNALLLKAYFPEAEISVNASCCAGVTPQTHQAALDTMRCCQIQVLS